MLEKACLTIEKLKSYKKDTFYDLSELTSRRLVILLEEWDSLDGEFLINKNTKLLIIPKKISSRDLYFQWEFAKNTSVNIKFKNPINVRVYWISNNVYIENAKNVHNKNIWQRVHNENIKWNVLNTGVWKNAINENIKWNVINFSIWRRTFNVNIAWYAENYNSNKVYNFNVPYVLNQKCTKSYNKWWKYVFNIENSVTSNKKNYFVYNQNISTQTTNISSYIVMNILSSWNILNQYVYYLLNYRLILDKLKNIWIFSIVYNKDISWIIENNWVGKFVICDNTSCKVINKWTIWKFYSSKALFNFFKKKPFELENFLELLYKKIKDKNIVEKIKKMMNL